VGFFYSRFFINDWDVKKIVSISDAIGYYRRVFIQRPPISLSNPKFVLVALAFLDVDILLEYMLVEVVGGVFHEQWNPFWVGKGASQIYRRLGAGFRVFDCHSGSNHDGGFGGGRCARREDWLCGLAEQLLADKAVVQYSIVTLGLLFGRWCKRGRS